MKQGRQYSIVILWILLLAIAVWFGYNVYSGLTQTVTTTNAVEYEAGAGCYATGFVVRDESVIHSSYGITVITASEGAHIAKEGSVATGYLTDGAQQRQNRIAELRAQIEQLSYAGRYSSNAADVAALDAQISSDLQALARYLCRRDMNSAEALSPELKGLILSRTTDEADADKLTQQLNGLHEELDRLQAQAASDTRAVTVSSSGYFSGAVDGFEAVLPGKNDGFGIPRPFCRGNSGGRRRQTDPRRHLVFCDCGSHGGSRKCRRRRFGSADLCKRFL